MPPLGKFAPSATTATENYSDDGATPSVELWECGDDFLNKIPLKGGEDDSKIFEKPHWKVLLDSYLEKERKELDSWKDEVNALLTFAGLFSAVVTAFLVESYKFLLPREQSDLGSTSPPNSVSTISLNSLWFLSLVLSLSAVVFGIVGLQWLRSHQQYHCIKPRDALAVYQMRSTALRRWRIRWLFLSLPVLILVALLLFLIGLVNFLLALEKRVAAPIAFFAYTTIAILGITTVLPSSQILKLYICGTNIETEADIPSPCPYKSPQSWIFHRLFILSNRCYQSLKQLTSSMRGLPTYGRSEIPIYFAISSLPGKWTEYDTRWLRIRDMYSQYTQHKFRRNQMFSSDFMQHPRRPIYDEANILKDTIAASPSARVLFAAYHCFNEVSEDALLSTIKIREDNSDPKAQQRNGILRSYYWKHISGTRKLSIGPPDDPPRPSRLLHDENMLVFLSMHSSHSITEEASRTISAHLCELQSRILAFTYAENSLNVIPPNGLSTWLFMMARQYIDLVNSTPKSPKFKIWSQFAVGSLCHNEVPITHAGIHRTIIQFSMIFERFVGQFIRQIGKAERMDLGNTIYAHPSIVYFSKVPGAMLRYTGTDQSRLNVSSLFAKGLTQIQDMISSATEQGQGSEFTDYLFLCGCQIVEQYFSVESQGSAIPATPFMTGFLNALDEYEKIAGRLDEIQKNCSNVWSGCKFGLPWISESGDKKGRVSYIPWDRIPTDTRIDPRKMSCASRPTASTYREANNHSHTQLLTVTPLLLPMLGSAISEDELLKLYFTALLDAEEIPKPGSFAAKFQYKDKEPHSILLTFNTHEQAAALMVAWNAHIKANPTDVGRLVEVGIYFGDLSLERRLITPRESAVNRITTFAMPHDHRHRNLN